MFYRYFGCDESSSQDRSEGAHRMPDNSPESDDPYILEWVQVSFLVNYP
jgi:hypothetical protein